MILRNLSFTKTRYMLKSDDSTPHRSIGHSIQRLASLPSTNSHAAAFGTDPANHGLVIIADSQSAGRGQYERTWSAPSGSSILMSVLLFPSPELRRPAILTAWAAVSVCRTIGNVTGLDATIKWPNDVLIDGRKVCGILCEGGAQHVVAGIGLNVNQSSQDFKRLGLPLATSLGIERNSFFDVPELISQLVQTLNAEYERLPHQIGALEQEWKQRIGLLGKNVIVEQMNGQTQSGQLVELSFDGIHLVMPDAQPTRFAPEIVRHITAGSD